MAIPVEKNILGITITKWKVSKYSVSSGPYFSVFALNTGKYGLEITPYFETFHAVHICTKTLQEFSH